MKHKNYRWHLNLQLFAEEPDAANGSTADPDANPESRGEEQPDPEKKYTDKDVDAIVSKKFAKWKVEQETAVKTAKAEAEKLAKMNAEQKQKYELEKLQKENDELKAAAAKVELGRTATSILREHKIDATQDILDFVVGTDAEDTKGRIDRFVSIINAQIKAAEVSKATGSTPRSYQNNGNVMSEIDKRIAKYK